MVQSIRMGSTVTMVHCQTPPHTPHYCITPADDRVLWTSDRKCSLRRKRFATSQESAPRPERALRGRSPEDDGRILQRGTAPTPEVGTTAATATLSTKQDPQNSVLRPPEGLPMQPETRSPALPCPLIHYSDVRLKRPRSTANPGDHGRPCGLWVSVGDAWLNYQRQQSLTEVGSAHYPHQFRYASEVIVRTDHGILVITSEGEFDAFNDAYSEPRGRNLAGEETRGIPWGRVLEDYTGIIIAPYLEVKAQRIGKTRMPLPVAESEWYYTWVVASGCLWDATVIEDIDPTLLPTRP